VGSYHSHHLRHDANSAGLDNNFSDYSCLDDFLEQCHTYCFQAPSTSSLPLIWACAQKSALYALSPALAVTWLVNKQKWSEISRKCCSCSLHPDMARLLTGCILWQIICLFVISPRGLSFCLSSPSPHQPFSLWARVCLHFHFLVWHLVSEWLLRMVDFQFTGSDLSNCSWYIEICKVYGVLANQMHLFFTHAQFEIILPVF